MLVMQFVMGRQRVLTKFLLQALDTCIQIYYQVIVFTKEI